MLVDENHHKIQSRCLAHEFSFTDFFNDINHGYKAAFSKRNYLGLLSIYMNMVFYCYYEKRRRTNALLKYFYSFSAEELNNIESEDEVFAQEFSC